MPEAQPKFDIVITLKDSNNTKAFSLDNGLIHQSEFDKVKSWIDANLKLLEATKENKSKKTEQRHQDTISILGSRGSGKSSLLMSILHHYKDNNNVQIIGILDPTLIEDKGHVFLTIISQISDLVNEKFTSNSCNPEKSEYHTKKSWLKCLRELADGLPTANGMPPILDESWQDPEYIMNKGLKSVSAARSLEKNFHAFVEESLKVLDKKAFILPLDDIDVDFQKGWPVLETLRKYLTTPRIIPIISGDLLLFSKAIRKQQWANFGKALLKNEAENLNKTQVYNDLVTEMEGQYLQKVMKSERRIHLRTLLEKTMIYNIKIAVKSTKEDESIELKEYYNLIFAGFGIQNLSQVEAYRSFMLSLPLRTQIQFLLLFEGNKGEKIENIEVTDPFLSDLFEKEVDVDLAKNMPKMLNVVILKLLLKEEMLSEAYQLQPTTSDLNLNSSLTALNLLFSQQVKNNPYLIFDYFIKIGYTRNLLSTLNYEDKNDKKTNTTTLPSVEGLCKHAEIYQDKVLRDIVGNMTAYIRGSLNYNYAEPSKPKNVSKCDSGIIPIYGLAANAHDSNKKMVFRIDRVFKDDKLLAYIPLSSSEFFHNSSTLSYSVFNLLATIGQLIKEKDNLEEGLNNYSQLRSYSIPDFGRVEIENEDEDEKEDDINISDNPNHSELSELLTNWIDAYKKTSISPQTLGKISTRFYSAINAIDKSVDLYTVGEIMHRYLVAFLNAVLIEDARENTDKVSSLNLDNAVTSDKIFTNNLNKLAQKENKIIEKLLFSKWILSCPLILVYLKKELVVEINKVVKSEEIENKTEEIDKLSIYENLCKVLVNSGKISFKKSNFKVIPMFIQQAAGIDLVTLKTISKEDLLKRLNEIRNIFENMGDASIEDFYNDLQPAPTPNGGSGSATK